MLINSGHIDGHFYDTSSILAKQYLCHGTTSYKLKVSFAF